MGKLAVVLFNLGGPDRQEAVRPFLFNLFSDKAIINLPWPARLPLAALISTTRAPAARANYALMGGGSPLLPETIKQAEALEAELERRAPGTSAKVFVSMRYWKPDSRETAKAVRAFGPDQTVLLPLYPQFSTTTSQSSLDAWRQAAGASGAVSTVCCYPDLDGLAQGHADQILSAWRAAGAPERRRLLFSAHGLPKAVIARGDPYQAQVEASAAAVAARLGPDWDWRICYQSRVGPLEWLGPDTRSEIEAAAAEGLAVVITPIAFVSEHVETLVELDHEYAETARAAGSPDYIRAPALGAHAGFIGSLAETVLHAAGRGTGCAPGSGFQCHGRWSRCPTVCGG